MSDPTPIIQGEKNEEGVEILPPTKHSSVSMVMVEPPDIGPVVQSMRQHIEDILSIPAEAWPSGREIDVELQFAFMPVGAKVTARDVKGR